MWREFGTTRRPHGFEAGYRPTAADFVERDSDAGCGIGGCVGADVHRLIDENECRGVAGCRGDRRCRRHLGDRGDPLLLGSRYDNLVDEFRVLRKERSGGGLPDQPGGQRTVPGTDLAVAPIRGALHAQPDPRRSASMIRTRDHCGASALATLSAVLLVTAAPAAADNSRLKNGVVANVYHSAPGRVHDRHHGESHLRPSRSAARQRHDHQPRFGRPC